MIVYYAGEIGCTAKVQHSDSGAGVFIEISSEQPARKSGGAPSAFVIRLAQLSLPEDFRVLEGFVDFEVGDHNKADGSWIDCIVWLARELKAPLPAAVENLRDLQSKEAEKQIEGKLYQLANDQYQHVFRKALNNCKEHNALLYETYLELKELSENFSGPEKARQAVGSKLNAAIREILRRHG